MKSQPLIVYKSRQGKLEKTLHFRSINKTREWLRKEGCMFDNAEFTKLDNDSVELATEECEYHIESDPVNYVVRRRRHEQEQG